MWPRSEHNAYTKPAFQGNPEHFLGLDFLTLSMERFHYDPSIAQLYKCKLEQSDAFRLVDASGTDFLRELMKRFPYFLGGGKKLAGHGQRCFTEFGLAVFRCAMRE